MASRATPRAQVSYAQQRVVDFFRLHVQLYGESWRAMGWRSRFTQVRRFAVLTEVGPLAHCSVLDVGCGLGDLYGYLRARGIPVVYTGYDLLPEMVERARRRYPEAHFEVRDALQGLGETRFDYVFSSGAFNIDFGDNLRAVQQVLRQMYARCRRGVAINFLSTAEPWHDSLFYHYDPHAMLAFCRTFCPRVQLREGYLPNDFTLYLYPPATREQY